MGFGKVCLKDGRPLHMVKLVGAIRSFCVNIKHVQIDVEDGTRLVWVIPIEEKIKLLSVHPSVCPSVCKEFLRK